MSDQSLPLVSVVIPTHNRSALVRRALDSALNQDYPKLEIIVVDDGSKDDTAEVLAQYEDVSVIRLDSNQGGAAARNHGIRAASGELVAFLDSDDEWLPSKTRLQVEKILSHDDIGAVYSRHFSHDDATGHRVERHPPLYRGDIRRDLLGGRCPRTVSLFLVRKSALEDASGFDEALAGFQDTDLWIRLSEDWKFEAVDEALTIVHEHAGPRVTTDPSVRDQALASFLGKWGDEMVAVMGASGLAKYRRRQMAVAQGALVQAEVAAGRRRQAFVELGRYFRGAGLSKPSQGAGLLVACVFGIRLHNRARKAFRSTRRQAQ